MLAQKAGILMRVYKKLIGGKTIRAYNDSGVDWVVYGGCGCGLDCHLCQMRFKQFKFTKTDKDLYARTMKEAVEAYVYFCDIAKGKVMA